MKAMLCNGQRSLLTWVAETGSSWTSCYATAIPLRPLDRSRSWLREHDGWSVRVAGGGGGLAREAAPAKMERPITRRSGGDNAVRNGWLLKVSSPRQADHRRCRRPPTEGPPLVGSARAPFGVPRVNPSGSGREERWESGVQAFDSPPAHIVLLTSDCEWRTLAGGQRNLSQTEDPVWEACLKQLYAFHAWPLASHQAEQGSTPGDLTRMFACGEHGGRCRWPAVFLEQLPLPPTMHSATLQGLIGRPARLPPRRTGPDPRQGPSLIFASENRAGQCRWSADGSVSVECLIEARYRRQDCTRQFSALRVEAMSVSMRMSRSPVAPPLFQDSGVQIPYNQAAILNAGAICSNVNPLVRRGGRIRNGQAFAKRPINHEPHCERTRENLRTNGRLVLVAGIGVLGRRLVRVVDPDRPWRDRLSHAVSRPHSGGTFPHHVGQEKTKKLRTHNHMTSVFCNHGHYPHINCMESHRTMPLVDGFSAGSSVHGDDFRVLQSWSLPSH
ncbi:hypothetical protein PR048_010238 [Dryococelus australis]|uniref:Uncharacterized protein n=1 Tax=Dryococelus australis TaxID=614101 RepID=A0ABQ9I261_9NEOP|nr:hypothetical protein PR048_010238 [Dryococelus australis]